MDLPGTGIYDPATNPSDVHVVIFGATGYIGRYVTFEFIERGYRVTAFARERSGVGARKTPDDVRKDLPGARVVFGNVTDPTSIAMAFKEDENVPPAKTTIVISCLASRTGGITDSEAIDYAATRATLDEARRAGASHFILLSAVCVQKPELAFQRAKLKFEAALADAATKDETFSYSIVRPTAFFKSLASQVPRVKNGSAYVMFGDGALSKCNALSERDLATFMADCAINIDHRNAILPIGGPGEAVTPREQAEMLFRVVGKEPKFIRLPIGIMDAAISFLDGIARVFPFDSVKDAAEFGRIGKYYAVEDMVGPSTGSDTLEQFFKNAVKEGGMEGQDLGDAAIL